MIDMFYARRLFSLDKSNGLRTPLVLLENDAGEISRCRSQQQNWTSFKGCGREKDHLEPPKRID
jgi:hypothetical protein